MAVYEQINLVSDILGVARFTDPDLVDPWGIAEYKKKKLIIANNGTGKLLIYDYEGRKSKSFPNGINIPSITTNPAALSGLVKNPYNDKFLIPNGIGAAQYLVATEDGTVAGWDGKSAQGVVIIGSITVTPAVYKGLAIAKVGKDAFLYVTNFYAGYIEKYDSSFNFIGPVFDPALPPPASGSPGYAPFGIRNIQNKLYVTYALQNAKQHDDVPGLGNGYVDIFAADGTFERRLISQGVLNSPWGLAQVPCKDILLVGNFGDGIVHQYRLSSGKLIGTLKRPFNQILAIDGLWGLIYENDGNLFLTAGLNSEQNGLFAKAIRLKH